MQRLKASFDSTPLIYFAKSKKIDIILTFFEAYIDNYVYHEVVSEGKKRGIRDALLIESAIESKGPQVININEKLKELSELYKLGFGEISTIMLVQNGIADIAIIDDAYARKIAKIMGVNVYGSLFVLKYAVLKGVLKRKDAIETLRKIILAGFRISPELVVEFQREIANL